MITDSLNDEQKAAVLEQGNILLTACPGSGKTRVLIHKLAHELITLGENNKKRIVALTFTVRASEEIFRRLNLMGIKYDQIWSGTLHAFCLEWILKPYSSYLDELRNGYSIADETYSANLIDELKIKYGLNAYETINLRLRRNGSFVQQGDVNQKLLQEYHSTLLKEKLIDFDLLLFCSYKILVKHPEIQKTLSNLFKLIAVDEYQDTQDLLYGIISLIVKSGQGKTTMFLVGDTDQAIYTSLGGVAKTLEEIRNEIDNLPMKQLTLTGNYRSNQRIIDYYTHFQTQKINIKALGKNATEQGLITFNNSVHHSKLAPEIARLIQLSLDKGIPEDEICVLVPQWSLVISLAKKLKELLPEVNFDASGLTPMSKNRENIWYKLSRLFLTIPSPKIYSLRYKWATELIELLKNEVNGNFNENYMTERSFLKLVNSIKSSKTEGIDYLNDCFDQLLTILEVDINQYTNLLSSRELYFKTIERRLQEGDPKFPSDIESFKGFYKEMTGIVINTCVGIKGEEFETVISYGLLYGYIPHWSEIMSGNALSSSKKLMYVICSRAKTNLHLLSELGRKTQKGTPLSVNPELKSKVFSYDPI